MNINFIVRVISGKVEKYNIKHTSGPAFLEWRHVQIPEESFRQDNLQC